MKNSLLTLFIEIDNYNLTFFVCESDFQNYFKITFKSEVQINRQKDIRISDFNEVYNIIKKNIFIIEKKINFTFKEVVLILENFNPSFISLSGFKKLNGSQVLKENITYILNSLKSCVEEIEKKKKILHIFNSKFNLDNKNIENLPIGLFGDFYSHELSFVLINSNNFKNLNNIFEKCNLSIKKTLLKSFVSGAHISDNNINADTFFQIQINNTNSKVFYFENNSLKFEQDFNFGSEIIIKDISKITSLSTKKVKEILNEIEYKEDYTDDEVIEKKFFDKDNYRKIKKKLICDISLARVEEIFDLIILKNNNLKFYSELSKTIFLQLNKNIGYDYLKSIFDTELNKKGKFELKFLDFIKTDGMMETANKLVHFGWKKEAIPVTRSKKTVIARIFEAIFG